MLFSLTILKKYCQGLNLLYNADLFTDCWEEWVAKAIIGKGNDKAKPEFQLGWGLPIHGRGIWILFTCRTTHCDF